MRAWYKYSLDESKQGRIFLGKDRSVADHTKGMGGYESNDAYSDKSVFFETYFHNYHGGRLTAYDVFLRKHLRKDAETLSIASGRCANELWLREDGYKITCSDLDHFEALDPTRRLFPGFEFIKHDILSGPTSKKYDAVICLSLIYLFDDEELRVFFHNVSGSLNEGGQLLLDFVGSPDNFLSYLLHDVLLKYEIELARLLYFLQRGRWQGVIKKQHGYRRSDGDVLAAARKSGFDLICQEQFDFLADFRRSIIFNRLVKPGSFLEKVFSRFGRPIPYIRMGHFRKLS